MRSIALLFLLMPFFALSQNLVLNPSFEDTTTTNYEQLYPVCSNWFNPNGATADYFTPFWEELCCNMGNIEDVPLSQYFGYQQPQEGGAYCGIDIYESTGDTKEYLQGFLTEPLVAQSIYCVSIWINLADSTGLTSCDLQVSFTNEIVTNAASAGSLNLSEGVHFDISSIDTVGWTLFEGNYQAQGGEYFIYIGSNTPNEQLDCVEGFNEFSQFWNTAYILVDNISVVQDTLCTSVNLEDEPTNAVILFPNPFIDLINLQFKEHHHREIWLYNLFGQMVFGDIYECEQVEISTASLPQGSYILKVKEVEKEFYFRLNKF